LSIPWHEFDKYNPDPDPTCHSGLLASHHIVIATPHYVQPPNGFCF
jgi:hypothetical protein